MKIIIPFVLFLINFVYSQNIISRIKEEIKPIEGFPIWLKIGEVRTDQTSGIAFIKEINGEEQFLLIDDVGKVHELRIKNNVIKYLKEIQISESVKNYLSKFPKWDFEEICYDKFDDKYYLSIEGNGPNYTDFVGIYELKFNFSKNYFNQLKEIKKIEFPDNKELLAFTRNNIGFEGVGVSKSKLFLGLEGFEVNGFFLDSTLIYVFDKKTKKLQKTISTKNLEIYTICGLYAESDEVLYGVDRNRGNIFKLKFNKNLDVIESDIYPMNLSIPNSGELKYTASIESVTLNNKKDILVIDDPWMKNFIPKEEILKKLKKNEIENFNKFIPIMFKFRIN